MKQLVGLAPERIQFFNNLNVKKYWDLELENVINSLKCTSSGHECVTQIIPIQRESRYVKIKSQSLITYKVIHRSRLVKINELEIRKSFI
jgi:hypothetical protein